MDYITFAAKRNIKEDIPLVTSENNEKRYVVFSASPLLNKDGRQNEGFLLEGFDVTERKAWEEELKIAHLKAEAGNMAKSQFLANISHDIRTPLTAILGFTEILKNKNLPLSPKELGFLDRIEENGKTLISLIDLILDLEKIEVGKLKVEKSDVNLADLIKKITDQLEVQFLAKPDLKLILELPSPLEPVYTDPQKLTQILMNLIANSIKFTTKGYLKIKVIADESTQVAKKIEISDSGNGMEKEELTKIFDAFYQVRGSKISKKLGIGLGLAIVKSLCDLLDYDISVKSEPGKGTTFTILLS
jgi:signal transduction histidine kinase